MRRTLTCAFLAGATAAPAFADTVDVMLTRGFFIGESIGLSIAYTPLGEGRVRMTATVDRTVEGTMQRAGPDKLCVDAEGKSMCLIVPPDKASNDKFRARMENGPELTIILN